MKLNRKWLLVVAVVMSLAVATTGTLAFLTDTDTKVNTFTVGNVDIEVEEEFEQNSPLNPGVEVEKQAGIHNVHDTSSAWVWMTVSVPENLDPYLELGWADGVEPTKLDTPVHEGCVSYLVLHDTLLEPDGTTPNYLESVTLADNVDYQNGEYVAVVNGEPVSIGQFSAVDVVVDGFAIQAEGFDTVGEAYDAYVAQWEGLNGGMSTGTPVETPEELLAALEEGGQLVYTGSEPVVIDEAITVGNDLKLDLSDAELVFEDGGKLVADNGAAITVVDTVMVVNSDDTIIEVTNGSSLTLGSGTVLEDVESMPSAGLINMYDYNDETATLVLDGATISNNDNGGTGMLFNVGYGSTLSIEDGTEISGNTFTGKSGNGNPYGLMSISSGAVAEMNGGEITGNTFDNRALIDLVGGDFVMNGGTISDNECTGSLAASAVIRVAHSSSAFDMNDGAITGNSIPGSSGYVVNVMSGAANINGGEITGNTASKTGNALGGTFTVGSGATVD